MRVNLLAWGPALLLGLGALATLGAGVQRGIPLRVPLDAAVPARMDGFVSWDLPISREEQLVAGMDQFVARAYGSGSVDPDAVTEVPHASRPYAYSIYVGYYERQIRGRTIHSPKNCLPGSGWEALTSDTVIVQTASGPVTVNRYLLQRGQARALVLYWYQGRGRVESNEYAVKWDLLRDSALRRRSDEALVRVLVPVTGTEEDAFRMAARVAGELVPAVYTALPL